MSKPKRGRPALGAAKRVRLAAYVEPSTAAKIEALAAEEGAAAGRVAGRLLDRMLAPVSATGNEKK